MYVYLLINNETGKTEAVYKYKEEAILRLKETGISGMWQAITGEELESNRRVEVFELIV